MVAALLPTLDNSIYARVVDGLESRLSEFGLSLIVAQTTGDPALEHARARQLIGVGAEGLVVVGVTHSSDFHEMIERTRIPVLAVSYYDPSSSIPTIGYDNAAATRQAVEHLCELGHRNIAVVHGPLANNDRAEQRKGVLQSMSGDLALQYLETDLSFEGGCRAGRRLAALQDRPAAALCFSDVIAMGVITELQKLGIFVPDEIAVLGMEDLPSSASFHPSVTSVQLQVQKMGERAAEALAHWVEQGVRPNAECLRSRLIARESTIGRRDA